MKRPGSWFLFLMVGDVAGLGLLAESKLDDEVSLSGSDSDRIDWATWEPELNDLPPRALGGGAHLEVQRDGEWRVVFLGGACDVAPDLVLDSGVLEVRRRTKPPPFAGCADLGVQQAVRIGWEQDRAPAAAETQVRLAEDSPSALRPTRSGTRPAEDPPTG